MQKPEEKQPDLDLSLDVDMKRLRHQLDVFQRILSKKELEPIVKEFDAATEQIIGEIFGSPSEMMEAYTYAQLGEAGGLINLPEEAQGPGEQDTERQSLHQRERVIERCIAELEVRRTRLTNK